MRGCIGSRDGTEARLAYLGHVLMENRHGLIVEARATHATGHRRARHGACRCCRRTAWRRGARVGADKAYDTHDFVTDVRALGVTPHVSQNVKRAGGSAIDGRTTRHAGYAQSQACRPRVERVFGWIKSGHRTRLCSATRSGSE